MDLEQVYSFPGRDSMAEHWFSPAEQAGLFALAPEIQMEAFFHIWTQKEAFLKAHGEGLSLPLQDFSVSVDPNKPGGVLSIRDGEEDINCWKMHTISLDGEWWVAVCVGLEADAKLIWHRPELASFVLNVTSRETSFSV